MHALADDDTLRAILSRTGWILLCALRAECAKADDHIITRDRRYLASAHDVPRGRLLSLLHELADADAIKFQGDDQMLVITCR